MKKQLPLVTSSILNRFFLLILSGERVLWERGKYGGTELWASLNVPVSNRQAPLLFFKGTLSGRWLGFMAGPENLRFTAGSGLGALAQRGSVLCSFCVNLTSYLPSKSQPHLKMMWHPHRSWAWNEIALYQSLSTSLAHSKWSWVFSSTVR